MPGSSRFGACVHCVRPLSRRRCCSGKEGGCALHWHPFAIPQCLCLSRGAQVSAPFPCVASPLRCDRVSAPYVVLWLLNLIFHVFTAVFYARPASWSTLQGSRALKDCGAGGQCGNLCCLLRVVRALSRCCIFCLCSHRHSELHRRLRRPQHRRRRTRDCNWGQGRLRESVGSARRSGSCRARACRGRDGARLLVRRLWQQRRRGTRRRRWLRQRRCVRAASYRMVQAWRSGCGIAMTQPVVGGSLAAASHVRGRILAHAALRHTPVRAQLPQWLRDAPVWHAARACIRPPRARRLCRH